MPSQKCGLTTRSLAELAFVISRVAPCMLEESACPSIGSLRSFWQCGRSLERRWKKALEEWTRSGTLDIEQLEQLAPRIFACEMVVRTWSTVLASLDRQRGNTDLTLLARNVASGLLQVRNGILSRLLLVPEIYQNRVLNLDRLRRRCDRWTDLLLSRIATNGNCFEFAFDAERARDFGEEFVDSTTGANAVEHLVSAGLQLAFIQHLSSEPLDEPEFVGLTQSILATIPNQAFHRDGSLRTLLERRIAVSRQRLERRAILDLKRCNLHGDASSTMTLGGHFFQDKPLEE